MTIWDTLIDLFDANKGVRYDVIFLAIFLYFTLLWLVVCGWVYLDAKRRYQKTSTAVLWACLVFLLNLPTLILYFIMRPEEDWEDLHHDGLNHTGGVNVPIINFADDHGVHMTLELRLHPKPVEAPHGMTIDVGWQSDSVEPEKLEVKSSSPSEAEKKSSLGLIANISRGAREVNNYFSSLRKKASEAVSKSFEDRLQQNKKEESSDTTRQTKAKERAERVKKDLIESKDIGTSLSSSSSSSKKKSKKKRKKKKKKKK